MMKQVFLILLTVLLSVTTVAQVGINIATPDNSAILDINSEDKGVLFPRLDLGNTLMAQPVTNPAIGLLVWNTDAANGGVDKGVYYWDNRWVKLDNDDSSNTTENPVNTGTNSYAQLTLDSDFNTSYQRFTFTSIDAASSGFATPDILVNDGSRFSVRPTSDGLYRVTFTITYKKSSSNNGSSEIEFYLFKNNNAIDEAKINAPLFKESHSVTFSKLIRLEAFQYYGIGISKSNVAPNSLAITILRNQTNLSIEKI